MKNDTLVADMRIADEVAVCSQITFSQRTNIAKEALTVYPRPRQYSLEYSRHTTKGVDSS